MKLADLSITLIEVGNTESPNIGTITGLQEDELRKKAIQAIESHFDAEVKDINIQDKLNFEDVRNSNPLDAVVILEDGDSYNIEIQQTFLY